MFSLAVLLVSVIAADAQSQGDPQCLYDYGFFPHEIRCDQYYACEEGFATLKTCGNGLAFDDSDPESLTENCDYFRGVDCSTRPERAPPIPTLHCDYQHGVFPDKEDCTKFWSCWDGEESTYQCSNGLAYNGRSGVCDWMDKVEACAGKQLADQVAQSFQCPESGVLAARGSFSRHPHPDDCRQYYLCFDGVLRELGCPIGSVFQIGEFEGFGECKDPLVVPGCEDYYGDLDLSLIQHELPQGASDQSARPKPVPRTQSGGASLRAGRRPQKLQPEELVIDAAPLN